MGTNSFHMIIAKLKSDGAIKIIDREKELIRLGSHGGRELSFISEEETALVIKVLTRFKHLADSYGAGFRAVATSAVREATNKSEFIKTVKQAAGIDVEIVNGRDEAELIYLGAQRALSLHDKNVLCIDIGGGSTEVINVSNSETVFAESIKIGAVRLSKLFFPDYILSEEKITECSNFIDSLLRNSLGNYFSYDFEQIVGSSGTVEALAAMILQDKKQKVPKSFNAVSFNRNELSRITTKILSARTKNERLSIPGMEDKRADIIPAGVLILEKIFELFGISQIIISGYALREGIILDMMRKYQAVQT